MYNEHIFSFSSSLLFSTHSLSCVYSLHIVFQVEQLFQKDLDNLKYMGYSDTEVKTAVGTSHLSSTGEGLWSYCPPHSYISRKNTVLVFREVSLKARMCTIGISTESALKAEVQL